VPRRDMQALVQLCERQRKFDLRRYVHYAWTLTRRPA
jgi:hypothetical protein